MLNYPKKYLDDVKFVKKVITRI